MRYQAMWTSSLTVALALSASVALADQRGATSKALGAYGENWTQNNQNNQVYRGFSYSPGAQIQSQSPAPIENSVPAAPQPETAAVPRSGDGATRSFSVDPAPQQINQNWNFRAVPRAPSYLRADRKANGDF